MALFRKKENKDPLKESEISIFSKKAYDLGFEVGYHKHSQIGWVAESYSELEDFAKEHSIEGLFRHYYKKGKEEGFQSRKRDMQEGLSRESKDEYDQRRSCDHVPFQERDFCHDLKSSYGRSSVLYAPIEKPQILDRPEMISLPQVIQRPKQIEGFRPLIPKK